MPSPERVQQYENLLQMPLGKASGLLRKQLLFHLAQQLGLLDCFRCGSPITTVKELSIDHKLPWRNVSAKRYWDMGNIAFSHNRCNKTDRPGKLAPAGYAYCNRHRDFFPIADFDPGPRQNGLAYSCRNHRTRSTRRYPCPECGTPARTTCSNCGWKITMKAYMQLRRREGATY